MPIMRLLWRMYQRGLHAIWDNSIAPVQKIHMIFREYGSILLTCLQNLKTDAKQKSNTKLTLHSILLCMQKQ